MQGTIVDKYITATVFQGGTFNLPEGLGALFGGLPYLTTIQGIENLDTSSVTSMTYMFNGDSSLTELDLSSFDMYNVTSTEGMFHNTQ